MSKRRMASLGKSESEHGWLGSKVIDGSSFG